MAKQKKKQTDNENSILTSGSEKISNTYSAIEDSVLKVLRWLFGLMDHFIFNAKNQKLVALFLAVILFTVVNFDTFRSVGSPMEYSRQKNNVQVNVQYNKQGFVVEGIPSTVTVTISGNASAVTSAYNSSGYITANLQNLTEGEHTVKLVPEGFSSSVKVTVEPNQVNISIKEKTSKEFDIGYDFINQSKMNSIYSLGTPSFESSTVLVTGSKDTLNSIAFVKALIDVTNVSKDFEQDAKLVAYNSSGEIVNCEMPKSTVHVSVPVTSPSKTVPISVETIGQVPDDKAIESITLDSSTVTIYASESVLDAIENVVVSIDASTITGDTRLLRPITLPQGVNSASINQVNVDVMLGDQVSKVIEGVPLNYRNNDNGYKISAEGFQSNVAVTVYGTQSNVDLITANDITAYLDFSDVQPGVNDIPIHLETTSSAYVRYVLNQESITVNVLSQDQGDTNGTTEG